MPSLAHRVDEARLATGSLRHLLFFGESGIPAAINIKPFLESLPPVDTPVDRSPSDMAIPLLVRSAWPDPTSRLDTGAIQRPRIAR